MPGRKEMQYLRLLNLPISCAWEGACCRAAPVLAVEASQSGRCTWGAEALWTVSAALLFVCVL